MKTEEHGLEEQLYCICRTSDANRFMMCVMFYYYISFMLFFILPLSFHF